MKVLHVFFSLKKGGAETYLFNLIKGMKGKDVEFYIVTDNIGYNHNKINKMGIRTEVIPMKSILDIKAAYKLAAYCKRETIEVIHTHFLRESFIAILSKLFHPKIKVIWTMHFIYKKGKILERMHSFFSRFASKVICVSKAVEDSLIDEGIKPEKTEIIYNSVDTESLKPVTNDRREELGLNKDEFLLITVARFQKVKGHDFLMDIVKELKAYPIKFKVLLVGDGKEMENIKEKAESFGLSDYILFLGFREDIPELLSASDLYISPSISEAFPFVILEALSCKVPVVATRVGGVPEILEESEAGIMIPYGQEKTFAKTIYHLYNNEEKYRVMKEKARELILKNYSLSSMVGNTHALYQEVLNGNRK